jgi:hypothetical protein
VRSIPSRCNYRGQGPSPASGLRSAHVEGMQERLNRLESLVTTLVAQEHLPDPAQPTVEHGNGYSSHETIAYEAQSVPVAGTQRGLGVLKVNGNSSVYRGSTHWRDVMSEVRRLTLFKM